MEPGHDNSNPHPSDPARTRLGEKVCAAFGFQDARGRDQITGCVKALRQLEGEGHFTLPVRQSGVARSTPVCLDEPVPPPVNGIILTRPIFL